MADDYVIPNEDGPRTEFRAAHTTCGDGRSEEVRVLPMRYTDDLPTPDPPIYQYTRNYPMLKTFHPFRQLRDAVWREYALISERYHTYSVLDLQTGEVIATREDTHFCPADFYVPDWWDHFDHSYLDDPEIVDRTNPKYNDRINVEMRSEWDMFRGDWGLVAGCVWGDDSSWKVRYIDLSRITEGIVLEDDRFGYIELPDNLSLKQATTFVPEVNRVTVATPIHFDRATGEAGTWTRDGINFRKPK